jgi:hypothetical protein
MDVMLKYHKTIYISASSPITIKLPMITIAIIPDLELSQE